MLAPPKLPWGLAVAWHRQPKAACMALPDPDTGRRCSLSQQSALQQVPPYPTFIQKMVTMLVLGLGTSLQPQDFHSLATLQWSSKLKLAAYVSSMPP